jgi:hypothetical protein
VRINVSFVNVFKKPNSKSEVITQILYGETFKIIERKKLFIKIKNDLDNYKGYILKKNIYSNLKNTHKVYKLNANLYNKPAFKYKNKKKLSFGSKIRVLIKKNNFCKFDNFWIKKKDLKKINYKSKDIFKDIKKFTNVKYKWGGKHYTGVDCSGLVQLFLHFNNKYCPRDARDQILYFKKKISLDNVKKNDLIFWKGHVAVATSKQQLIHAYGPLKKTVVMPIKKAINRIQKTANLKILGIRRVN